MKDARLAIDFGAGSGRVIAATCDEGRLQLDEVHRFVNRQIDLDGWLYWDILSLWQEMKTGIRKAADKGYRISSIGVDTWGVDFGLLDVDNRLIGNPICYRDSHVDGQADRYFADHDINQYYSRQGIQIMDINTIFRLLSLRGSDALRRAKTLLMMPDLFNWLLTGRVMAEYTEASTTGLLDARSRDWDRELIESLDVDPRIFPPIAMPGTVVGTVLPRIASELGISPDTKIIAVGSHDTASAAYAALRGSGCDKHCAFLSCGTWSLLGVPLDQPILTKEARLEGFSNEGGVGRKILFLQNITGLWILQQLVAQWQAEGKTCDYPTLTQMARDSAGDATIDVDDPSFARPGNMAERIREYCRKKRITQPQSQGDFARCVISSLALRYRSGIEGMNRLLDQPIQSLTVIGGGAKNPLLIEATRRACGIPVEAGPVEATAIGNILLQMASDGLNIQNIKL